MFRTYNQSFKQEITLKHANLKRQKCEFITPPGSD